MSKFRRMKSLGAGLLAGLVAALFMTAVMSLLRLALGIPLPSEMGGDRFLPLVNIYDFLGLLGQFGGPNTSKMLALATGFEAQVLVGTLIGLVYATVAERERRSEGMIRRFDVTRRGKLFVVVAAAAIWLVTLAQFSGFGWSWSVLAANFRGAPPWWAAPATALGLLISYAAYGVVLVLAYRLISGGAFRRDQAPEGSSGRSMGRGAFLVGGTGVLLALSTDWLTQKIVGRSTLSYDGMTYSGTGLQPITPNDEFYVVTKNIVDPYPLEAPWRLRVDGQVENPRTYAFEDLSALESVEQEMTLECISNSVGGGLMSNAIWRGVPLARLIEAAGPSPDVREVIFYAVDDYTHSASIGKAMEETTLLAYEMNGERLPQRHGFPARLLVPGYYGEASVKWITRIELRDTDEFEGYYGTQGWDPRNVHTGARIDQPEEDGEPLSLSEGILSIKGVAFAGDRGISQVEVSTDGGENWREATIDYEGTRLTWVFWSYEWEPDEPGEYQLLARATDGDGELQEADDPTGIVDGASGYHMFAVQVEA